ncbi:hypothetical protein TSUD_125290 [Trifolium subterraneum]|uniref:Uncharacterized protein n=1 Tax=Trifolium subterraneum TaxID=3900 RepID=A0A2Z6N6Q6_TRISU|nr:hypothetical protein TSUD_125290 [Trifolium subterraneum]
MEGCLTDLGKTFAEKLINGVIQKSRYLFCFKCIANDFESEKKNLEAEWKTMIQRFTKANENGKDIKYNAKFWEEEANKLIQEDTKLKQRCFFGFCPDCIWRYKRGEELANKIQKIKELMVMVGNLENVELPRSLPDVERYSSQSYILFKSRELKYQELLDALKDDSYYMIGLHGMGGTGKTTMAKEVGNQLKDSKQFNRVIITTVSNTPNIKKIQDDIAGSLGLVWKDKNESNRPKELWNRLTNGEKILVILDDVWGDLNFDDIGIPNSYNHKGCKVLVTTRYLKVCKKMACGETIQLELLSKEEAWDMFKIHADLSNISYKDILNQGRKIADECKGLPIAITTIASSLKGEKSQAEWDAALTSLQSPMSMGDIVNDELVDIFKCLKVSYDFLKDKKAKELFLLCSIFQEDEEISTEILTRLGIGVGLFGEGYGKYNIARNQVVVAKNKLLDSCLLMKTNKGDVKMHDLIREVAQWIASKEILAVDTSNKNQKSSLIGRDNNIKYLLFDGNPMDLCSSRFDGSKLEILILMVTGCFVDSFFENIAGLRVLNLIAGEEFTLSLPQSIRSLINIRSLLIKNVDLGDISVLGSLQSLETLDLNRCSIEELPQEIAEMKKLRLLNLKFCRVKRNNPFEVIQRCPSLEELYFWNSFNKFCQKITIPALERYLLIHDFRKMHDFSPSKYVSLRRDYLSEATFKHVIQTAEILKLQRIKKGWINLIPEIVGIDQGMNDLIELRLKYDSHLQCLVDTEHIDSQVPNVFSKLVVLELGEMENLKELCNGPICFDSLSNLEKLYIDNCEDLGSLFKCSLNLCNLKIVSLSRCSKLVSVFDLSTSQSLVLLERLSISRCEQLENIFSNDGDNDNNKRCNSLFPKLESIYILRCYKLKYIFGQHQDVELASLKELKLHDRPNFIDIFPESNHSFEGSSHSIYKPQTELEVEPIKSNKFPWSHMCCYGHKLRGSSSSTSTKVPFPSVYEDEPQHCSISLHIVVDIGDGSGTGVNIVFPKLKELTVIGCKKLEYIFGHINASDLQNYLRLPALISLYLSSLPSLIGMGTKNYHMMLSHLGDITLIGCPHVDNKSFGDFVYQMSKSQDSTTIKLIDLIIEECDGLKYIIEEDDADDHAENKEISNYHMSPIRACFPKLRTVCVVKCNKLKYVLPSSMCTELPNLWLLMIGEASKLEKIFGGSEEKVGRFPNLYAVVFVELPSFFQGIQFQTVQHRLVHNCQNLSLTSTSTDVLSTLIYTCYDKLDNDVSAYMRSVNKQLEEHSEIEDPSTSETEDQSSTSGSENAVEDHSTSEIEDQSIHEGSTSETRNKPPMQLNTKLSLEDVDLDDSKETTQTNNEVDSSKEESESTSRHKLTSSQIQKKQEAETEHEFVENVPDLEIPPLAILPTNSEELVNPQQSVAEIDTTVKPSQDHNDIEISVEEGTTSTIPMEDINNLMEEDPLLALVALENLLTRQASISSIRVLLQELKTLMDSSSDLDHLVSNQESKLKLISLFHQLNQHQRMLTSDEKDFVEKVQNFFIDNIIKHNTSQKLLKKYNQVLDSKTDLMNKLRSAKNAQTNIDSETSTTNAQIHELSLQTDELRKKLADLENQIDGLKSVAKQRDVQKMKLKAECSELAQQSKELLSALTSLEVDIREAERARNLAKEGFANLKSSFPAF